MTVRITHDGSSLDPVHPESGASLAALSSSGGLPEDVQKFLRDQFRDDRSVPQDDRRHLLGGSGLSTWPEGRRSRQACGTRALIALLPGCDDRDLFVPAGQERHPIRAEGPHPPSSTSRRGRRADTNKPCERVLRACG